MHSFSNLTLLILSLLHFSCAFQVVPEDVLGGTANGDEENEEADATEAREGGAEESRGSKPPQMTLVFLHDGNRLSIYRLLDGAELDAAANESDDDEEPPCPPSGPSAAEPQPRESRTSDNRY